MKSIWVGIAILLFVRVAWAQDEATESEPSFDAAAEVAAASAAEQPAKFERLWTSPFTARLFQGLSISADGSRVIACRSDGRCVVLNGNSGDVIVELKKTESLVMRSALSPDGLRGAIGTYDGQVLAFDTTTGETLRTWKKSEQPTNALYISSDSKFVSWVDSKGGFYRGEIDGEAIEGQSFQLVDGGAPTPVYAFSPQGNMFLCRPSIISKAHHWLRLPSAELPGRPAEFDVPFAALPAAVALSPKHMAYYTVQGDLVLHMFPFRAAAGQLIPTKNNPGRLMANPAETRNLAISSDDRWLLSVGRGQVEIRALDCMHLPSVHAADFREAAQVALAPDVLRFAVVDQDGHVAAFAIPAPPEPASWHFRRLVVQLGRDKRWEDLDKIGDLLQNDPAPFPFHPDVPKYHFFQQNLFGNDSVLKQDDPPEAERIEEWLAERPDSKLARVTEVRRLIQEGWQARGSGFAQQVTQEGWETFHLKLTEAHAKIKPLLEGDSPPPEAFMLLFDIAKAEGWDESKCLDYADEVLAASPEYLMPHLCLVEKLLPRWGGGLTSSADYAEFVADKVGGDEGDALYARLALRVADYEIDEVLLNVSGLDFDRALKGCTALQSLPHRREVGLLGELRFAVLLRDHERVRRVVDILETERLPFVPGIIMNKAWYERVCLRKIAKVN